MTTPFYTHHVFICANQKAPGKVCCANTGGEPFFEYMKSRLAALDMHGPGKVRITQSGCLGRCKLGPGLVIYPDNVWYRYASEADIDEIIQTHLIDGHVVERLLMERSPDAA
ncbi:MAG: (2Fe-2S) ferredoxin domain-containing protein [Legionella sp.]|jgi:(2Fe-2S) ferredoxin|nr:(2Fe-2S) ferredoxin domain-containing protein [Legionella sp.]